MESIYFEERDYVKETEIKRSIKEYSSKKTCSCYSDIEMEIITTKNCKAKNKLILSAIEVFPEILGFLLIIIGGPFLTLVIDSPIVIPSLLVMLVNLLIMMKMVICRNEIKESQDNKTAVSVRDAEKLVRDDKKVKTRRIVEKDKYLTYVEEMLAESLSARVNIKSKKNKGKIEIQYNNNEDLNRLLDLLKIQE